MRRFLVILMFSVCFAACSGNPPAWWNPGNRYGQIEQTTSTESASVHSSKRSVEPIVSEVVLDPLPDNSYEEETIVPLPEEEDTPAPALVAEPALDDMLPTPSVLE